MKLTSIMTESKDKDIFLKEFHKVIKNKKHNMTIVNDFAKRVSKNTIEKLVKEAGKAREKTKSKEDKLTYSAAGEALLNMKYSFYQHESVNNSISSEELFGILDNSRPILEKRWYGKARWKILNDVDYLLHEFVRSGYVMLYNEWGKNIGREMYLVDKRKSNRKILIEGRNRFDKIKGVTTIDNNFEVVTIERLL